MSEHFKIGQTYTTAQIKEALGNGTYQQVVVTSKRRGILCIRFRTELNLSWKTKGELWIHKGERRITDAEKWIESDAVVPVFCAKDRTNNWTYQGDASAKLLALEAAAVAYTKKSEVGLVLEMQFKNAQSAVVRPISQGTTNKTIIRKKAA
jgi:hypothetical protein